MRNVLQLTNIFFCFEVSNMNDDLRILTIVQSKLVITFDLGFNLTLSRDVL